MVASFYVQHRRKAFRGGAAAWTPAELTTGLWLDNFSSGSLQTLYDSTSGGALPTDGSAIARWDDQSGNARHATQSSSGLRPLRRAAFVNGIDALDFDGSNDYLTHSVVSSDPDNLTIAAIVKGGGSGGQVIWSHRDEDTRVIQIALLGGGVYYAVRASGGDIFELTYTVDVNDWNIIVATLDVPGNSHKLRVNGLQRASSTLNFGSQNFTSTINSVGAQNTGTPGTFVNSLNGELPAVIVMPSTISQANAEKLEGYWAHKFGQTSRLDSGHPYKTVAP